MKFAHEYRNLLETEGYPARWVASAVPYRQLKKYLKKAQKELQILRVDPAISQLPNSLYNNQELIPNREPTKVDIPKQLKNFQDYIANLPHSNFQSGVVTYSDLTSVTKSSLQNPNQQGHVQEGFLKTFRSNENVNLQLIKLPNTFNIEFFDILKEDVASLDLLQAQEQESLSNQIETLSSAITSLAKPSKFRKTDMYRWRELFDIYLQAGIFFSSHEQESGNRDSHTAEKQLRWFQSELLRRGMGDMFKLTASREALNHFVDINNSLLQILKFQEINQKAISKILKKFVKRTNLNITNSFLSNSVMSRSIAKVVCSKVMQDLVKTVPRLDDYLCPICLAIIWQPIRLKCHHIFCIQCTITLQKQKKRLCPLCRKNVIMDADQGD